MVKNIKPDLSTTDNLSPVQADKENLNQEKVHNIPLDSIDTFPNHSFLVKKDDEMQAMVESIKTVGIQTPAVVRSKPDGRYELISGHRRKMACELAGLETLPCIIREMGDDEAIISMVESNLQREIILPSEKAKSYKLKLDAMKRKTGRPSKKNVSPVGTKLRSDEELAVISGDSRNQIHRFIRLNNLILPLLDMVDNRKFALRPAVEISYLPLKQQEILLEVIEYEDTAPSQFQASQIRRLSEDKSLNKSKILSIMQDRKPTHEEQFRMSRDKINKFFPAGTTVQTMEETIIKALELFYTKKK